MAHTTTPADFARDHGLSPAAVKKAVEGLSPTTHFEKSGRRLTLTEAGVAALLEAFGLKKAAPVASAIDTAARPKKAAPAPPAPPALPVQLVVLQLLPNPIFVRVRTPEGKTADVHIKPGSGIQPGHRIACKKEQGAWHCAEPRLAPRR